MSNADEMRKKTVCFTGHRQMGEPISEVERRLTGTVDLLIQKGCLYFGAGGARGFDALASEVVFKLKAAYPQVHLILVLPFPEQYRLFHYIKRGLSPLYRDSPIIITLLSFSLLRLFPSSRASS